MMESGMNSTDGVEQLALSRDRFLAFVNSRISDPGLAEDIVQTSLVRAAESIDNLKDRDRLVPWFYAILRNAVTDSYRQHAKPREVELPANFDIAEEPELERHLCECFAALLPSLKPEYAELIESLDLANEGSNVTALRLGLSVNNLKVRHHRARQALKRKLEETCRVCAEHHCLDCTCQVKGAG
jgi:RNA polymerase sigma-70 factor (ECF subfamily)